MTSDPKTNSQLDRANQLFLDRKFREAVSFYDLVLQDHPDHVGALNNKGYALSKLGDYRGAISCYEAALESDPDDTSVTINKISSLRNHKRPQDAMK